MDGGGTGSRDALRESGSARSEPRVTCGARARAETVGGGGARRAWPCPQRSSGRPEAVRAAGEPRSRTAPGSALPAPQLPAVTLPPLGSLT